MMAKLAQNAVTPISQDDAETARTVANQYLCFGLNSQGVSHETKREMAGCTGNTAVMKCAGETIQSSECRSCSAYFSHTVQ